MSHLRDTVPLAQLSIFGNTRHNLEPIRMSLVRALTASALGITSRHVLAADAVRRQCVQMPNGAHRLGLLPYVDTPQRRAWRSMLDAAASVGATVKLGFLKTGGELRYMVCQPCLGVDETARYYTVQDLELSETRGCAVYRRVCLDTIAACHVEYRIGAAGHASIATTQIYYHASLGAMARAVQQEGAPA